jgi:pimeloyl-ACP methyl ester carboxylesterase
VSKSAPVDVRSFGSLSALVTGTGPPLALLPGLSPENGIPVGPMRTPETQLMSAFAHRFTVYWVARPTGLGADTTLADIADQVAAGIEAELVAPVAVLGISTGGSIAQQLAADHPALVRRLVLMSTGYRLGAEAKRLQRDMLRVTERGNPRRVIATMTRELVPPWRGRTIAALAMYMAGPRLYPGARRLTDLQYTLAAEDPFDLRALPTISAPTLVISGGQDRFYEPSIIRETAELIPGARLSLYRNRGHVTVISDRKALTEAADFMAEP